MKRIFYSLLPLLAPFATISADNAAPEGKAVGIVAHRGYWNCEAGGRARNSLAAFKAAHEAGFWGTEFDVCMTADGEMIVFHDETLNGKRIDHTDWAEIAGHRLENGEPFPGWTSFWPMRAVRRISRCWCSNSKDTSPRNFKTVP